MKHLRLFRLIPIVITLLFSFSAANLNAQTHTAKYVSMISNSGGYYEYLPQGYSSSTQSYPLIIFIHGVGELGDGSSSKLPLVLKNGIPRVINQGQFPSSFTVGGQTHRFIVLSPQFKAWPKPADINSVIDYAVQHYRVNQSRIYVSGLSMGGGVTWDFAATYPSRVTAIVPVCGASGPNTTKATAIANGKVQVWATHNDYDPTVPSAYTKNWVSYITQAGGNAKKTIWALSSHDAWTKTYAPTFVENNLNVYQWLLQYQKGGSTTSPTAPTPSPAPVAIAIAGKAEAEGYASMYGVKTQTTSDVGGGLNVGWIDRGDWMDYSANVSAAGTYKADFRIATAASGAQLQIKNQSGTVLATANVPNTGGYQNWQTVSVNLALTAGAQTLRLYSSSASGSVFNINWINFSVASTPTTTIPSTSTGSATKIEAEKYASMYGVRTETTSDIGGGLNVGWIDNGDWMNYSYSAPASGSYTMNFRVATPNNGGQLQIKNQSGTVLATVNVPNTGAYQSYQTVSATINLTAGAQTLKVQSSASPIWNFNWIEMVSGGSSTLALKSSTTMLSTESTTEASAALQVFPNPVTDRFALQINNDLTGAVNVQVLSLSGALQKQFSLNKTVTGTSQFYLSIGELPAANYIIKASMNSWTQSTQIVKQ
jgi:predicted esterase